MREESTPPDMATRIFSGAGGREEAREGDGMLEWLFFMRWGSLRGPLPGLLLFVARPSAGACFPGQNVETDSSPNSDTRTASRVQKGSP